MPDKARSLLMIKISSACSNPACKPKEAEPYLRAAWFSQQNVIVGNHLAQAFESLDRNADALWMYRLARQADHAPDAKQDSAEVAAAIARLEKAGVKAASGEHFATAVM